MRTGISDGAAKPHVIATEREALRIGERVLHVGLLHSEVPVAISSVVSLVPFRHLPSSSAEQSGISRVAGRTAVSEWASNRPRASFFAGARGTSLQFAHLASRIPRP